MPWPVKSYLISPCTYWCQFTCPHSLKSHHDWYFYVSLLCCSYSCLRVFTLAFLFSPLGMFLLENFARGPSSFKDQMPSTQWCLLLQMFSIWCCETMHSALSTSIQQCFLIIHNWLVHHGTNIRIECLLLLRHAASPLRNFKHKHFTLMLRFPQSLALRINLIIFSVSQYLHFLFLPFPSWNYLAHH